MLKGFVTLKKYKAVEINGEVQRGELILDETQQNTILARGSDRYANNSTFSSGSILAATNSRIQIHETDDVITGANWDIGGFLLGGDTEAGISNPSVTVDDIGQTIEWLTQNRFDPPPVSTTRNITVVSLANTTGINSSQIPSFAVNLNTPCTQQDDEILDIFYKVVFDASSTPISNPDFSDAYWKNLLVRKFTQYSFGPDGVGQPSSIENLGSFAWTPNAKASNIDVYGNFIDRTSATGYLNLNANSTNYDTTQRTRILRGSRGLSDSVGRIFSTMNVTANNSTTDRQIIYTNSYLPASAPKEQSIFLHSATAIRPYLDVSNLGGGTGELAFDTSAWTARLPEMLRVEITTTGDAGVGEYRYKKRRALGFSENDYSREYFWPINSLPTFNGSGVVLQSYNFNGNEPHITQGVTPNNTGEFVKKYDQDNIIIGDYTGITFVELATGNRFNIDAASTPQLLTSAIRTFDVAPDGSVYIATSDAGLFLLSSNQSVLTQITGVGVGVTDTTCYYVSVKDNGDVWAAFEGGLAKSTDSGSTWTIFNETSAVEFTFAGISDNNWSNIIGFSLDKETADDRLLILRSNNTVPVWWSRQGSQLLGSSDATLGVSDTQSSDTLIENFPLLAEKRFRHIRGTNTWLTPVNTIQNLSTVDFGANTRRASSPTAGNGMSAAVFTLTDASGNERIYYRDSTGLVNIYDIDFNLIASETATNPQVTNTTLSFLKEHIGNGIFLSVSSSGYSLVNPMHIDDPLSGALQDYVWEDYGWDGANWVLGNINSKPIHLTSDLLFTGVDLAFVNATNPSFTAGEYFSTFIHEGVHKDNATSLTWETAFHYRETELITDVDTATVPTSLGSITNVPLNFYVDTTDPNTTEGEHYQANGQFGRLNSNTARPIQSELEFAGDFVVNFKYTRQTDGSSSARGSFGIAVPGQSTNATNVALTHGFLFTRTDFDVIESGVEQIGTNIINNAGDEYTLERVGTTINFRQNGVIVFTSSTPSTGVVSIYADLRSSGGMVFYDMNASYTETRPVVEIGNGTTLTGRFASDFALVESYLEPSTTKVQLDATDALVIKNPTLSIAAGEVLLLPKTGWLVFNPADIGRTVTGEFVVMKKD